LERLRRALEVGLVGVPLTRACHFASIDVGSYFGASRRRADNQTWPSSPNNCGSGFDIGAGVVVLLVVFVPG
jgi:hypothetical protein